LQELKEYFNDKGAIRELKSKCSIYTVGSKDDLISTILPKIAGKELNSLLNNYSIDELNLPLVKFNKIYYTYLILNYKKAELDLKNKQVRNDIIRLSYFVFNNTKGLTLEQYKKLVENKLNNNNIIEDIV
jgi:hypothetical protein